jgi:lipopolysaccharide transport system permease protein
LVTLTESDLRARYGRGRSRVLKWLLDPFALVGIYLLLVTIVFEHRGDDVGLSIACSVVPFQLVLMSVVAGVSAVYMRSSIILNTGFDRLLVPISAVLTETVAFGASLLVVALMMVVYAVTPTLAMLWLLLVIPVNVTLAVAAAYAASLFGIWFIHLRLWLISFVRTLFFLSPGLVPLSQIGGRAHDLLRLNPLTGLFEAYRAVVLNGHRPAAWQLLYPLAVGVLGLAVLVPVYQREQRHFAKVL